MRHAYLLLALPLLAGCMREATPLGLSGEQLMVHSVLVAGEEVVHVLVERTVPEVILDPYGSGGSDQSRPVSGAEVQIIAGSRTIQLQEAPAGYPPCVSAFPFPVPQEAPIGPGCYVAVIPGGVRPAESYRLRVQLDGGGVVEGEARAPGPPEITSPAAGQRYGVSIGGTHEGTPEVRGILIRYRVPEQVAGVRASLIVDSIFTHGARDPDAVCSYNPFYPTQSTAPVDSIAFLVQGMYCYRSNAEGGGGAIVPDSIFGHVALAAFDSTYVGYSDAAQQGSVEPARLRAGLTGALGLFAGASRAEMPVVLLPSPRRATF